MSWLNPHDSAPTAQPLSIDQACERADNLFEQGAIAPAKDAYLKILAELPNEKQARIGLRKCAERQSFGSLGEYVDSLLRRIALHDHFVRDAIVGWTYSVLVEPEFVSPELHRFRSPRTRTCDSVSSPVPIDEGPTPAELLQELRQPLTPEKIFARMREVTQMRVQAVRGDSFCGCDDSELTRTLRARFRAEHLNVLIIGAGCTGLTLANALKSALGQRVNILVVENRIVAPHVKEPYSRAWLTLVSLDVLDGMVDAEVVECGGLVGRSGYMGLPINVFETLLLLSCKSIGVQFLFAEATEAMLLQDLSFQIVFDATGGRLQTSQRSDTTIPGPLGPVLSSTELRGYGAGYRRFGIHEPAATSSLDIPTRWYGARLVPLHNDAPICVGNIKLTGVPLALYPELMERIVEVNGDGRFYVWPGTLQDSINELLLLICLKPAEFEVLGRRIERPQRIADVVAAFQEIDGMDERLSSVLSFLAIRAPDTTIEPPFTFAPYVCPYSGQFPKLHGTPAVPIGDSIFVGNPKTGNGLGRHLAHIRRIHDDFLAAMNDQCV